MVSPLGVLVTQQFWKWVIDVIKVIGKERLSYHGTDESAESLSNEIMFQGMILKISFFFFLIPAILSIAGQQKDVK